METVQQKYEKALADAEAKKAEALENLRNMSLLPEKLQLVCKYYHTYKKHDYASFEEVPDFKTLFELLEGLDLIPLAKWSNGCTHLEPLEGAPEEACPIAPVTLRSQQPYQHGKIIDSEASFYLKNSEGKFVHCRIDVKETGRRIFTIKKFGHGYTHITRTDFKNHCGNIIRWAAGSPEYPNSFTEWGEVDQALEDYLNENCKGV